MLRMTLTLTSGVQIVYDADEEEAAEHIGLIQHTWQGHDAIRSLTIPSPDGVTDWVRLADVAAMRCAPAALYEQKGHDGAATG